MPFWQISSALQACPHAPQWSRDVWRSMPGHWVWVSSDALDPSSLLQAAIIHKAKTLQAKMRLFIEPSP